MKVLFEAKRLGLAGVMALRERLCASLRANFRAIWWVGTCAGIGFGASGLAAQNPLTPEAQFLADPAVRMAADGTLYAIGSVDVEPDGYCSTRYAVLASRDRGLTWTWHPDVFASAGEGDESASGGFSGDRNSGLSNGLSGGVDSVPDGVPYNDRVLFAPDWLPGPDGWTLYYCQPDRVNAEGVASAPGPLGPFTDGEPLPTLGYPEIDPAVFRDDDGSVYYLWGQFSVKMARLMPDGRSLDSNSLVTDLLTEREHGFHEGVSMAKRRGLYYLVYAYMGRADRPTGLAWAWSKQALGPYAYGGVLIDNDGCDPGTWNNHGCIAPLDASGERWAVFYHRSTQNSASMRKACAEPISFNAEGHIAEVTMTSQGLGPPLPAERRLEARLACLLHGEGRIGPLPVAEQDAPSDQTVPEGASSLPIPGEGLIGLGHRDRAAFKYLAFGNDVDSVRLRVLAPDAKATLLLRLDQPWGPVIARVEVPASTQWQTVRAGVGGLERATPGGFPHQTTSGKQSPSPENEQSEPRALWVQVLVPENPEATLALDWLEFK
jgi:hypothetical protein